MVIEKQTSDLSLESRERGNAYPKDRELAVWLFKYLSNSSWWCGQSTSVRKHVKEGAGEASGTPWK